MIVNRSNAPHYLWGDGCDGWRLHEDDELGLIEELVPPGCAETPHYHTNVAQIFYILHGEAVMRLTDRDHTLHAGDSLRVPPGVAHQFRNDSADPVRFLVITAPRRDFDRHNIPLLLT